VVVELKRVKERSRGNKVPEETKTQIRNRVKRRLIGPEIQSEREKRANESRR